MFRWFAQTLTVTWLSVRSLPQRAGPSIVAVVGFTGVVITFVAVLSIAEGFGAAMSNAGSPDTAIIMRGGSNAELNSALAVKVSPGKAGGFNCEPLKAACGRGRYAAT